MWAAIQTFMTTVEAATVTAPFILRSADGNPVTRMGGTPIGLAAGIESDRSHELLKVPSRMILRFELIALGLASVEERAIEETLATFLKRTVPIHEEACFKSITADAFMLHQ